LIAAKGSIAAGQDAWTLGVLFSRSGLMEIPSTQHVRGAMLAIDEVNAAGGVLGRPLNAIHYDTRSDLALYRQFADRLLTEDGVGVILGCCTSLARKAVLPAIERRNGLLWYPDLYEGFEYSPNVIYVGAATNQNSLPLARYLFGQARRRFMLIGSDYIYPREANRVMRDLIERHGGEVLDEIYLPMGTPDEEIARLVARVKALGPDAVFSTLVGSNICRLCERYADAGIDPADIPIASHNVTEAELATVGRAECAGHVTAAPYFSSVDSGINRDFVRAFRGRFGGNAPVSQYAVSAYSAVRLFAATLGLAGEMDTQRMMQCARGLELEAPHGRIVIDLDNNHTWMTPRVGVWNGVDEFDVVWESDQVVQPDPWLVSYGGVEELPQPASPAG
jgi:ABC-type branched-subunit amino acid transport system substrate-binding protein